MIRIYIRENQGDWDEYFRVINYGYNSAIINTKNYALLGIIISRPKADMSTDGDSEEFRRSAWKVKKDWVFWMEANVAKEQLQIKQAQVRYEKIFYKRMRRGNKESK